MLHVRGRKTVVQAGGNIGIFPKRMAESFANVHTFEPDLKLFGFLAANVPERNVVKYNAALGYDRTPVATRCVRRDTTGRAVHEGLTHINGPGTITQMRVDDLRLASCDLIYLDIEGYEYFALRGAEETIRAHRPAIVVEINSSVTYYGHTRESVVDFIRSHGYVFVKKMDSDELYIHPEKT